MNYSKQDNRTTSLGLYQRKIASPGSDMQLKEIKEIQHCIHIIKVECLKGGEHRGQNSGDCKRRCDRKMAKVQMAVIGNAIGNFSWRVGW